jgi:hypothetical protein
MPQYPTLTDCLAIISSKVAADQEREAAKQREIDEQTQAAIQTIRGFKERITNLVLIANSCAENQIPFPYCEHCPSPWWVDFARLPSVSHRDCFGYNHSFISSGFYHNLGLVRESVQPLRFNGIGIDAGGACGPINLWTDGESVLGIHESTDEHCAPPLGYLQEFVEEFPKLEKAFYAWIASLQEKGETK